MDRERFNSPVTAILFYAFIVLFAFITLFPLLWVFKMSIVSPEELFASPPTWWPHSFTWDHYKTVWDDPSQVGFRGALLNSVVIAGITTIVCLVIGSVCAYAIARIEFFIRRPVSSLVLAITFFPAVAILGPLFLGFQTLGIFNTYWAAIIPDTLFALPLTVYLLAAYFRELPRDLEEAAKVDGATTWQAFRKVTIPLSAPGVVTTGLLTFIFAWNEFLFANTFLLDKTVQPATVIIPQFATIYTTDYGAQAAAAIIMTAPLVILVLFFQRRIVSGLTAGATTG
jgi:multiple sugar transport system permease protein